MAHSHTYARTTITVPFTLSNNNIQLYKRKSIAIHTTCG
uniref:Uncharacterized protein n=1 Tax=Anguilla anguilla TaxID=7936 RepID=A0A0E9RR45_ANGAN